MNINKKKQIQLSNEEIANSITHGSGFFLSILGLFVLLRYNNPDNDIWRTVGFSIFGISLALLYLSSTLYHSSRVSRLKKIFRRFDHSAIFLLIAGTYTPIVLIALRNNIWVIYLFIIIWAMAVFGIIGEFLFTKELKSLELTMYIAMGWMAVIVINPLLSLPDESFFWIISGGLIYSLGIIFFKWDSFPFNHAIWHLFVLAGSFSHFLAMFYL